MCCGGTRSQTAHLGHGGFNTIAKTDPRPGEVMRPGHSACPGCGVAMGMLIAPRRSGNGPWLWTQESRWPSRIPYPSGRRFTGPSGTIWSGPNGPFRNTPSALKEYEPAIEDSPLQTAGNLSSKELCYLDFARNPAASRGECTLGERLLPGATRVVMKPPSTS
jgi:hypothetical protein